MNKINIKDLMKKYMDGTQDTKEKDAVVLFEQKISIGSTLFMPLINTTIVNDNFVRSDKDSFKKEILKDHSFTGSMQLKNVKSGFANYLIPNCIENIFVSYNYPDETESKNIKNFEIVHKDQSKVHKIRYIYNSDLILVCINYQKIGQYGIASGITEIDMCFSPNDEYYEVIIKAHVLEENSVKDILPESIIPSAYNFDENWEKRVELFKMMFL